MRIIQSCACVALGGLASAQLASDTTYVFSQLSAEHDYPCGLPASGSLIAATAGTIILESDGGYSVDNEASAVCAGGTLLGETQMAAGAYELCADGLVTLDMGAAGIGLYVSSDLDVIVGSATGANSPALAVATRTGSGLGDADLDGEYHVARLALDNSGAQTAGEVWYGRFEFDGAGTVSGTYDRKHVDAAGFTTFTEDLPFAAAYSLSATGALTLDGATGGFGAASSFFHALDATGPELALLVGFPVASAATDATFAGPWGFGDLLVVMQDGDDAFCSEFGLLVADDARTDCGPSPVAALDIAVEEVCSEPSLPFSSEAFAETCIPYSVAADGSLAVDIPGAVSPDGRLAFAVDASGAGHVAGELSLSLVASIAGVEADELVRAGTPANPIVFLPGTSSGPVIGGVWDPSVDHTSFEPAALGDFMLLSAAPIEVDLGLKGTLLCNVPFPAVLFDIPPSPTFLVPIPDDCSLVGLSLCAQVGSSSDGNDYRLTNALDITIGTY